ncbi:hypothetical protein [Haliscomenobacter hydrossis]|uniref:Lipoprotein n=1 Tax=Haliscomenobacter hydrossis (strain ATCC 27775 / DSM 1100 / LMG 10767 / O) TaxID=760192 RepID=F4L404_HALH1|nr:hypothetical protein [Haliscomenobacter hydrossis]AEE49721.1 hypothetical protein Halhy_1836 [Haliscomenobacter hydrossis DSM 1100]
MKQFWKISLLLTGGIVFFAFACQSSDNKPSKESFLSGAKEINRQKSKILLKKFPHKDTFIVVKKIVHGKYSLDLVTCFLNDSLEMDGWNGDHYSNPVVKKQYIVFYEGKLKMKQHNLPIKLIGRETKGGNVVSSMIAPIHEFCLMRGKKEIFYHLYGADFCSGSGCTEFFGTYGLDGRVILEEMSTLGEISKPYGDQIQVNKKFGLSWKSRYNCIDSHDFW